MSGAPDVTVVIATRNRRVELARALGSVRRQEGVDAEIVVVDDGSTDDTGDLLGRESSRGLIHVRHPKSLGVAAARNTGIARATASWLAFLDDDDLFAPHKLAEQLDGAARADRHWAYSAVLAVDELLRPLSVAPAPDSEALLPALLRRNVLAGGASSVCVQTQLLRSIGGFDSRLAHLADWDLWIRLASAASACRCEALHTVYVVHARGMVLADPGGPLHELELLEHKHAGLYRRHRCEPDRAHVAAWIADRLQREGRRRDAMRVYVRSAFRDRSPRNVARAALAASGLPAPVARWRHPPPATPAWLSADMAG